MPKIKNKPQKIRRSKDDSGEEQPMEKSISEYLSSLSESEMPIDMKPMLATLVNKPFDEDGWLYEVKWDGYRALAFLENGTVDLRSRNNKSFNDKFYPIHQLLQNWKINAVFDGEILVLNEKGIADFSALQNWRSEADGHLVFYIFDLLWLEGKNFMNMPLIQRQELLKKIIPSSDDDRIRQSKIFKVGGIDFFNAASRMHLEGIIAKKADSIYMPGFRSKDWLKIKVNRRQEVVIGGYTRNEGSSKSFSSLLLGVFENGILRYVGKVGTGFSDKLQKELIEAFAPLIISESPFKHSPDINKPSRFRPNPPSAKATWLKPELVCEVSFAEVTSDGVFRHPSFEGLREDKKAEEVQREQPVETQSVVQMTDPVLSESLVQAPSETSRKTLLNPVDETQMRPLNGHQLKFSHLSKIYWPKEGIAKRDFLNYYYQIAEYILPYLVDRPQSLNRFPNGISGKSFYQKNVKDKAPAWVETFPYITSEGEHKEFLVISNEASLMWAASLGCIEMNPWFSRCGSPDNPDYCVIDLDPDQNTFEQVIEAAQMVKKVLDEMDVPSYCKTSGSTGMHIYIPLGAKYSYDQSQLFGRLIANIVHSQLPSFTSVERIIAKRKGKMYIDFLQNRPGATLACPYSLRPKPGATVSMPVHWEEVKPGLQMKDFTIHNAPDRLKSQGDFFKAVLEKGIDIEQAAKKAQSVFNV